jgi:hypothetical protein
MSGFDFVGAGGPPYAAAGGFFWVGSAVGRGKPYAGAGVVVGIACVVVVVGVGAGFVGVSATDAAGAGSGVGGIGVGFGAAICGGLGFGATCDASVLRASGVTCVDDSFFEASFAQPAKAIVAAAVKAAATLPVVVTEDRAQKGQANSDA